MVVGDEHERDAHFALQGLELLLHLLAQLEVQRPQRLIQQQHLGLVDQRTGQRHSLLLAAGELVGPALLHPGQAHHPYGLGHPLRQFGILDPAHPQPELDVLAHGHVREQGVRLEHGVDRPPVRRRHTHLLTEDPQAPLGRQVEARDHAQGGGLAAARRPQQGEELPVVDGEVDVVDRHHLTEALGDAVNLDGRYRFSHRRPPARALCRMGPASAGGSRAITAGSAPGRPPAGQPHPAPLPSCSGPRRGPSAATSRRRLRPGQPLPPRRSSSSARSRSA